MHSCCLGGFHVQLIVVSLGLALSHDDKLVLHDLLSSFRHRDTLWAHSHVHLQVSISLLIDAGTSANCRKRLTISFRSRDVVRLLTRVRL